MTRRRVAVTILAACVAALTYAFYDLNRTLNRALRLPPEDNDA